MKFIIALSALVAASSAQSLASLPACGQLCVNNMLGLAGSLGCSSIDAKCLCGNANFGNGLRDCATEACGAAVASQVLAFGSSYCSQAGASIAGGAATASTAAAGATGSVASGASGAIASASSSASSALSAASSSISGALASATGSAASAASSGASAASSHASGASSSAASAASSATSTGFAMKTAAPMAGAGALGALAMLLV